MNLKVGQRIRMKVTYPDYITANKIYAIIDFDDEWVRVIMDNGTKDGIRRSVFDLVTKTKYNTRKCIKIVGRES